MGILLDGIQHTGEALLRLALNPFYYFGLLIVALLYRRQTVLERKLFFVRLHSMTREFFRALGWGFTAAALIAVATAGFGLQLTFEALLWTWGAAILLMLIRIRFVGFAYAAGLIALLQLIVERTPAVRDMDELRPYADSLLAVHLPSLFALVALLHAAEAFLVWLTGKRTATPLYLEGKRGKVVGAYQLQGLWAMPLLLIVPAAGDGLPSFPWPMFFGDGDAWSAGWTLLAFPVLIGFSEITVSERPEARAKRIAYSLLGFAVIMGVAAVLAQIFPVAAVAAAVLALMLREGWLWYSIRRELSLSPVFVHGNRGLKVLDVMEGSPASDMGILRGETILKANGIAVHSKEQLHAALRTNSAFCKLEILNLEDQNRFEHRALYDGEHHQLGLVLCPDDGTLHYTDWRPLTIYSLVSGRSKRRVPRAPQTINQEHKG